MNGEAPLDAFLFVLCYLSRAAEKGGTIPEIPMSGLRSALLDLIL